MHHHYPLPCHPTVRSSKSSTQISRRTPHFTRTNPVNHCKVTGATHFTLPGGLKIRTSGSIEPEWKCVQCLLQNTSKLKSLIENVYSVRKGVQETSGNIDATKKQYPPKNLNGNMHQKVPPSESLSEAAAPVILRIHGCLGLEEPLDNQIMAFQGCPVQRCLTWKRRPEAKPRAEPNGTKGKKTFRKYGHLKRRSVRKCGHSKFL